MKIIINNRLYDTDTAEKIAEWHLGMYGELGYREEYLYRKKSGEFFLYAHEGDAFIPISIDEELLLGGENIVPLTERDTKKWLEKKADVEVYESLFGLPEE